MAKTRIKVNGLVVKNKRDCWPADYTDDELGKALINAYKCGSGDVEIINDELELRREEENDSICHSHGKTNGRCIEHPKKFEVGKVYHYSWSYDGEDYCKLVLVLARTRTKIDMVDNWGRKMSGVIYLAKWGEVWTESVAPRGSYFFRACNCNGDIESFPNKERFNVKS